MTKNKIFRKVLCLALIAGCTSSVFAQDASKDQATVEQQKKPEKKKSKFGSFIRKVGESTTGINMSNETFVAMNINAQKLIAMEVISCVRDKASNTVILTLGVKAKQNGVQTSLGKSCGNGNQECVSGYDAQGNAYEGQEVGSFSQVSGSKENPVGIPIKYEFAFSDIPATLGSLEVVQVEFYIYSNQSSVGSNMSNVEPIQVRNIPIQ